MGIFIALQNLSNEQHPYSTIQLHKSMTSKRVLLYFSHSVAQGYYLISNFQYKEPSKSRSEPYLSLQSLFILCAS